MDENLMSSQTNANAPVGRSRFSNLWPEWIMDITLGDNPPCFVPYERETETIVFGMNLIQGKCPGKLVGVLHEGGQDYVDEWITQNPDWHERFS